VNQSKLPNNFGQSQELNQQTNIRCWIHTTAAIIITKSAIFKLLRKRSNEDKPTSDLKESSTITTTVINNVEQIDSNTSQQIIRVVQHDDGGKRSAIEALRIFGAAGRNEEALTKKKQQSLLDVDRQSNPVRQKFVDHHLKNQQQLSTIIEEDENDTTTSNDSNEDTMSEEEDVQQDAAEDGDPLCMTRKLMGMHLTLTDSNASYKITRGCATTKGKINDINGILTIDTGAGVTIMNYQHWIIIGGNSQDIHPYSGSDIVGPEGSSIQPAGWIDVDITVAGQTTRHPCILAQKFNQLILLGTDFLYKTGIILDIRGGRLWRKSTPLYKYLLSTDLHQAGRLDVPVYATGKRIRASVLITVGFWQVELDEESKEKTAFVTHDGLFQFTVMPFGLTNAPATFQHLMDVILSGLKWRCCLVYLDDVIIFSSTFDQHLKGINDVLGRLRQSNLALKASKCHFCHRELKYLGHIVSTKGTRPDPEKLKAVRDFPVSYKAKGVRSFLGLTVYYRRFIQDYATIAEPLLQLIGVKRSPVFVWIPECQDSFDELKQKLITSPIISYPDFNHPFILQLDAFDYGLGAVLAQKVPPDGEEHVIAYASRTLNESERKYSATERECLAIVWRTQHFRPYLEGRPFEVWTGHRSLTWLRRIRLVD
ncbi:unnamed protein product, partial [Didymodactylos carnosus]